MLRYSISYAHNERRLQYCNRTGDVQATIARWQRQLENWKNELDSNDGELQTWIDYRRQIRITDSETKEVVFEDCKTSEDFGWKTIKDYKRSQYSTYEAWRFERK